MLRYKVPKLAKPPKRTMGCVEVGLATELTLT
jgi:hypothetical protein